jgi:septal ring factor EnvC (AmiA/AmiB activator)
MKDSAPKEAIPPTGVELVVAGIGSTKSLVVHTVIFAASFLAALVGLIDWDRMLLVLTTLVSLEAIYLSLLIQITVNRHTQSLKDVEEDIEEIQEDVEELGEDMEDIQEDLEEISEDIEEISEDIDEIQEDVEELNEDDDAEPKEKKADKPKGKKPTKAETLEQLTKDVQRVLADLEALKKTK